MQSRVAPSRVQTRRTRTCRPNARSKRAVPPRASDEATEWSIAWTWSRSSRGRRLRTAVEMSASGARQTRPRCHGDFIGGSRIPRNTDEGKGPKKTAPKVHSWRQLRNRAPLAHSRTCRNPPLLHPSLHVSIPQALGHGELSSTGRRPAQRGVDVLGFGVGEPDFRHPRHIIEAAKRALSSGATRYTSVRGIPPLRRAIAAIRRRGAAVSSTTSRRSWSRSAPSTACSTCVLRCSARAIEAIVPTPCWVSYPEQCQLAGATAGAGGDRVPRTASS